MFCCPLSLVCLSLINSLIPSHLTFCPARNSEIKVRNVPLMFGHNPLPFRNPTLAIFPFSPSEITDCAFKSGVVFFASGNHGNDRKERQQTERDSGGVLDGPSEARDDVSVWFKAVRVREAAAAVSQCERSMLITFRRACV